MLVSPSWIDAEELELEFIDFGAEEVFEDEDGILIYAPFESFGAIQDEVVPIALRRRLHVGDI